jgi:hypothetical protein
MGPCQKALLTTSHSLTPYSLQRTGVQRLQRIFAAADEVGLLQALRPLCDRANETIIVPILLGRPIPNLQMDFPSDGNESLLDLMSHQVDEDDVDVDMNIGHPEEFKPIEDHDVVDWSERSLGLNSQGFEFVQGSVAAPGLGEGHNTTDIEDGDHEESQDSDYEEGQESTDKESTDPESDDNMGSDI